MIRPSLVAFGLMLSACLPGLPAQESISQSSPPAATVDLNLTAAAMAGTMVAETIQSAPSLTPIPSATYTAIPSLTAQEPDATPGTPAVTPPAGSATINTILSTATQLLSLETLPPGTGYAPLHLENKSNKPMDVTLYGTTRLGYETVLDYNHLQSITVNAPQGYYSYVAYVGGVQFTGNFSLITNQKLSLTFYKDRVVIH